MNISLNISVEEKGKNAPTWSLDGDRDGSMTYADILKHLQNSLIDITAAALKEEQAKGFDKNPLIVVDGKPNKPVTSVSPFGKIEVIARVDVALKLVDLYEEILRRSPVATGQYISSHVVFMNKTLIARDKEELKKWQESAPKVGPTDAIYFVNLMPYAGFLEREGITASKRGIQGARLTESRDPRKRAAGQNGMIRAPNGAYFLAHRSFKRKYKGSMKVFFQFTPLKTFGVSAPKSGHVNGKPLRGTFSKKNKRYKGPYVYPTIRVLVTPGGGKDE